MNKGLYFCGIVISSLSAIFMWLHFMGYLVVPSWFAWNVYFENWGLFHNLGYISIPCFVIGILMIYHSFSDLTNNRDSLLKEIKT